ncbi:ABC transporter substrate-binding protein [Paenibacillus eucommiae]|uniref:Multiple sugar transport system substrate-binding protein n=1 Tax=Paenibacillus eucommiae TaxID=1355755 RepID=A0ABS4J083_9BACL|nr:sugar ABC transporter substrate-binding protein [Paenibacillus eucommiae]MBP1993249.1 multiple sugar transport system substrate-binding protein [Paenibacillus eucommiae]
MKTRKRKWLAGITLCMMVMSLLLSACSSSNPDSNSGSNSNSNSSSSPSANPKDEKATIRFSTWYGAGDIEIWKEVIKRFNVDYPNITVKFEPLDFSAYWQKLPTQLASKSAPDVIGMHVGIVYGYVEKDQLEPMDSYLSTGEHKIDELPEALAAEGQWPKDSPKQYSLPWRFTGGALFVNRTAMEEANVAYPENGWTIDEFVAAAKKMTKPGRYGFLIPGFSMNAGLMGAFGTEPTTADKLHSNYNSPEVLAYKTWLHDLIYKDKVAPNPKDVDSKLDPFVSGKVAMMLSGAWNLPVYRKIENFQWDVAPMPTKDGKSKTYAGPDMMAMTKDGKHKEAAWKFIQFAVFNPKAQELLRTTGLPMLKTDLANDQLVGEIAAQKPEHIKTFLDGAAQDGIGYAFTKKFFEIGGFENDADVKILQNANADIKKELDKLHEQVNKEFEK